MLLALKLRVCLLDDEGVTNRSLHVLEAIGRDNRPGGTSFTGGVRTTLVPEATGRLRSNRFGFSYCDRRSRLSPDETFLEVIFLLWLGFDRWISTCREIWPRSDFTCCGATRGIGFTVKTSKKRYGYELKHTNYLTPHREDHGRLLHSDPVYTWPEVREELAVLMRRLGKKSHSGIVQCCSCTQACRYEAIPSSSKMQRDRIPLYSADLAYPSYSYFAG